MSAPWGPGQARRAAWSHQSPPLAQGCHPAWSLAPAADGSRPRRPGAGQCPQRGGPPFATFPALQRSSGMPKGSAGEAGGLWPRLEVTVKLLTEGPVKLLWPWPRSWPLLGSVDPQEGDPAQLPLPSRCLWFSKTSTWWKVTPRGRQDPHGRMADALGTHLLGQCRPSTRPGGSALPLPRRASGAPGYTPACSRLRVPL